MKHENTRMNGYYNHVIFSLPLKNNHRVSECWKAIFIYVRNKCIRNHIIEKSLNYNVFGAAY